MTSFQEDSFLHYCSCDVLTFPGREQSGLPRRVSLTPSVRYDPEPARARPLRRRHGRQAASGVPVPQCDRGHISYGVANPSFGVSQTRHGQVNYGPEQAWAASRIQVPLQTFSAKYKKWYVLPVMVGIDMYCVCIGIYPCVFYGAQRVCIGVLGMYLCVLDFGFSVQHEGACAKGQLSVQRLVDCDCSMTDTFWNY